MDSVPASGNGTAASAGSAATKSFPPPIPADKQMMISFTNYNVASAGLGKEATEQLINEFQQKFPKITRFGR